MKKITLGVFVFSIIALLGISSFVSAQNFGFGKMNQNLTEEESIKLQEFRDSLQNAISEGDYETWKSLMESQLTEENFTELVERQKEMEERKSEMEEQRGEFCEDGDYPKFDKMKNFGKRHMRNIESESSE
jgi:hypothetical protein